MYTLQLRGVTRYGGVTRWSNRSEDMQTGPAAAEMESDGIGVNTLLRDGSKETMIAAGERNDSTSSTIDSGTESVDDFSRKLEKILAFIMAQATGGVSLHSVRVPSIAEQAEELLKLHRGSQQDAISAAARLEDEASWRTKLPDFLIQQVPVVGCSTALLRELWRNIRRCALIAHLYGHDTSTPETQALILTCLVPAGGSAPISSATSSLGLEDVAANGRRVAVWVSRALAKETFIRMTGLRSAGQVVSLLEAAGRTLASYSSSDAHLVKEAGLADPIASGEDDLEQPGPIRVALVVFRPQHMEERPLVVVGFLFLWLLPVFVSAVRFVAAKLLPLFAKRVQMELPLAVVAISLAIMQVIGMAAAIWVHQNLDTFVSLPATLVFVIYALIPGASAYLAMRSVLQGAEEALFFALLGVYNLTSGYIRWADDLCDDAMLEKEPVPKISQAREQVKVARSLLWRFLLVDFFTEELLGRVCHLHSLRLLGPPGTSVTLVEYRTLSFSMGLLAAWAQTRVLQLLQRRAVLLRLLGARKAVLGGLTLLLMGAYAVVQQQKSITFLREVSPTPWWCCMVLWIRRFGALTGAILPAVVHCLLSPSLLGRLPVDTLVPFALIVGAGLGHVFCQTFSALWMAKKEHLESDYRVLFLFPHMSSQAVSKASVTMRVALQRGAQATKGVAGEWVTGRMVRTCIDMAAQLVARSRT